jgi:hypothetical protein
MDVQAALMQGVKRVRFCLTRLVVKMSSRQSSVLMVTTLFGQNTVYFKYSHCTFCI